MPCNNHKKNGSKSDIANRDVTWKEYVLSQMILQRLDDAVTDHAIGSDVKRLYLNALVTTAGMYVSVRTKCVHNPHVFLAWLKDATRQFWIAKHPLSHNVSQMMVHVLQHVVGIKDVERGTYMRHVLISFAKSVTPFENGSLVGPDLFQEQHAVKPYKHASKGSQLESIRCVLDRARIRSVLLKMTRDRDGKFALTTKKNIPHKAELQFRSMEDKVRELIPKYLNVSKDQKAIPCHDSTELVDIKLRSRKRANRHRLRQLRVQQCLSNRSAFCNKLPTGRRLAHVYADINANETSSIVCVATYVDPTVAAKKNMEKETLERERNMILRVR